MGLGDVNGDGRTDGLAGNLIRTDQPTVQLLPGSDEAAVEGTTSQPIVTLYTYNQFGQKTSQTDPEGNVTQYTYYPADSPDGSGVIEVPGGNATTGGYLASVATDTMSAAGRDSGTNPTPADIQDLYFYNPVGDVIRSVRRPGDRHRLRGQPAEPGRRDHPGRRPGPRHVHAAEPLPLTAFGYIERYFYDADNNVVLDEVEDRGNTSNVQGNPPAADLPILSVDLASVSTGRQLRHDPQRRDPAMDDQRVGRAGRPDHVGPGCRRIRSGRLQHGHSAHAQHPLDDRPGRRARITRSTP